MIGHNYALTSIAGLANLAAGSIANLNIVYNTSLTSCAVQSICDYLVDLHGNYTLYGNVIGYRNLAEVHADCEFLLVENRKDQNEITLFPNPARNRISITTPDEVTIDDAIIYSQTGQKVFQGSWITALYVADNDSDGKDEIIIGTQEGEIIVPNSQSVQPTGNSKM